MTDNRADLTQTRHQQGHPIRSNHELIHAGHTSTYYNMPLFRYPPPPYEHNPTIMMPPTRPNTPATPATVSATDNVEIESEGQTSGDRQTEYKESLLDAINEKATNIEHSTNSQLIKQTLTDAIRDIGRQERSIRMDSVTFKHTDNTDHDRIQRIIEKQWVEQQQRPPIQYRASKEHTFCKTVSMLEKNDMIDWIIEHNEELRKALMKPNHSDGMYFTRLPVKMEINNVKEQIKFEKISKILSSIIDKQDSIIGLKEGKMDKRTNSRSITFKADSRAVWKLIVDMDGIIPYYDVDNKVKAILPIRINCRPWVCKECHNIGQHASCKGKLCIKCGKDTHTVKDCRAKLRKCISCNRLGHKAKDKQCPSYLKGVAREIRKVDMPLEFLEDPIHVDNLIKTLQLK